MAYLSNTTHRTKYNWIFGMESSLIFCNGWIQRNVNDFPTNSHLHYQYRITSIQVLSKCFVNVIMHWHWSSGFTFVTLWQSIVINVIVIMVNYLNLVFIWYIFILYNCIVLSVVVVLVVKLHNFVFEWCNRQFSYIFSSVNHGATEFWLFAKNKISKKKNNTYSHK